MSSLRSAWAWLGPHARQAGIEIPAPSGWFRARPDAARLPRNFDSGHETPPCPPARNLQHEHARQAAGSRGWRTAWERRAGEGVGRPLAALFEDDNVERGLRGASPTPWRRWRGRSVSDLCRWRTASGTAAGEREAREPPLRPSNDDNVDERLYAPALRDVPVVWRLVAQGSRDGLCCDQLTEGPRHS